MLIGYDNGSYSRGLIYDGTRFEDEQQRVIYRYCLDSSIQACTSAKSAIVFHPTCVHHYDDSLQTLFTKAFRDKTLVYDFEPAASEYERRAKALQQELAGILRCDMLSCLPAELCSMIAGYCVREYAAARVVLGRWQREDAIGGSKYEVKIGNDLRAGFVKFDGVRYLASLKEWDDEEEGVGDEDDSQQRIMIRRGCNAVYLAMDHCGIREIYFHGVNKPPTAEHQLGIWWKKFSLKGRSTMLVKHDVSFLLPYLVSHCPSKNCYRADIWPHVGHQDPKAGSWTSTRLLRYIHRNSTRRPYPSHELPSSRTRETSRMFQDP